MASYDEFDFTPSAKGTLDNMRYGGIDFSEIIQELKDNSDDAKSTDTQIWILPNSKEDRALFKCIILDNGIGMSYEKMLQAFKIAHRHSHTVEDIGKFGVGLKNATMGLGNEITLVTKQNDTICGAYLNVVEMQEQDTFKPSDCTENGTIYKSHFITAAWSKFNENRSGTLILVKNIHSQHVGDVDMLAKNLTQKISLSYSEQTGVYIHTDLSDYTVHPVDLFHERTQVEYRYKTALLYSKTTKTVYEEVSSARKRGKGTINGPFPKYFKCNPISIKDKKNGRIKNQRPDGDTVHEMTTLPDGDYERIELHFIEQTESSFEKEGSEECWEGVDNRCGFYFKRFNRIVGSGMNLGEKITSDPWHIRFRMEVKFSSLLDLEMGVRIQKQLSGNTIHSAPISNALLIIWKQLCGPRINIRKKQEMSDSDTEPETEPLPKKVKGSKKISKSVTSTVDNHVTTEVPETIPTAVPETIPTEVPEAVPTAVPETIPTAVPEAVPTAVPEAVPNAVASSHECESIKVPEIVPTAEPEHITIEIIDVTVHETIELQLEGWLNKLDSIVMPDGKNINDLKNHMLLFWN